MTIINLITVLQNLDRKYSTVNFYYNAVSPYGSLKPLKIYDVEVFTNQVIFYLTDKDIPDAIINRKLGIVFEKKEN